MKKETKADRLRLLCTERLYEKHTSLVAQIDKALFDAANKGYVFVTVLKPDVYDEMETFEAIVRILYSDFIIKTQDNSLIFKLI